MDTEILALAFEKFRGRNEGHCHSERIAIEVVGIVAQSTLVRAFHPISRAPIEQIPARGWGQNKGPSIPKLSAKRELLFIK